MVVVKQRQPKAFFSFSFSCRLIVNRVRREREKKKREKNEDDDDDDEENGSNSGDTSQPRVKNDDENVDDGALPPLDDVVDTQHVLSHDMLMLYTTIRPLL